MKLITKLIKWVFFFWVLSYIASPVSLIAIYIISKIYAEPGTQWHQRTAQMEEEVFGSITEAFQSVDPSTYVYASAIIIASLTLAVMAFVMWVKWKKTKNVKDEGHVHSA